MSDELPRSTWLFEHSAQCVHRVTVSTYGADDEARLLCCGVIVGTEVRSAWLRGVPLTPGWQYWYADRYAKQRWDDAHSVAIQTQLGFTPSALYVAGDAAEPMVAHSGQTAIVAAPPASGAAATFPLAAGCEYRLQPVFVEGKLRTLVWLQNVGEPCEVLVRPQLKEDQPDRRCRAVMTKRTDLAWAAGSLWHPTSPTHDHDAMRWYVHVPIEPST